MKNFPKGISQIILIVLVFAVAIVAAAFLAYNEKNNANSGSKSPTPELTPGIGSTLTPVPTIKSELKTYEDKTYGFSFKYPASYILNTSDSSQPKQIVVVENRTTFDNTPLSTISKFSVSYFSKDQTSAFCLTKSSAGSNLVNSKTINSLSYRYSAVSEEAAAGSRYTIIYYRTFPNNKCFEISLSFKAGSDWNNPADQKTSEDQKSRDLDEINRILNTLTFSGTLSSSDQPSLTEPVENSKITSPLKVKGVVPPGWMFEGVFPVKITDGNKNVIVQGQGKETIPGSWQSGKAVEFEANISFSTTAKSGFIILENDNPSGDPSKSKTFEVPVNF